MFSIANQKRYAWIALAMGAGGALLFLLVCLFIRPPRLDEIRFYLWPVPSIFIIAVSAFFLKLFYRRAPETAAGYWHLSITDLIAISVFAATCLSGWRALWPNAFVPVGIAVALVLALAFTVCLLFAARKGYASFHLKTTYALGLLFQILGWMGLGAILSPILLNLAFFDKGRLVGPALSDILFFTNIVFMDETDVAYWILNLLRAGWLCVPIGFVLGLFFRFLVSLQRSRRGQSL